MNITMTSLKMNKTGATLTFVIIILAVVSIFSLLVFNLSLSNLAQAKAQERQLQAYYLALSGSELCYTALLQEGTGAVDENQPYEIMFKNASASFTETLTLEQGEVNLTISSETVDEDRWIIIGSTSTLTGSSVSSTVWLHFLYSNPIIQKKS